MRWLALCVLVPTYCYASDLPNHLLTPGAVRNLTKQQVCSQKWTLHTTTKYGDERPSLLSIKRKVAKLYSVPWNDHSLYQFDHLVPRCLGGADVVTNVWPQPVKSAAVKDRVEKRACKLVCAGKLDIEQARTAFMTDWRELGGK